MKATLIDKMGTDLSVVNAARVSFAKESEWEQSLEDHVSFKRVVNTLSERDARLISYLAKHSHWTPFAHTAITVHVKAPLFVARQLGKHQVGMVWNEVSRRYVTEEPEFYQPEVWRKAAENVKQGSSDEPVEVVRYNGFNAVGPKTAAVKAENVAFDCYRDMIESGVCPEQARMVLPQSMYTEWYWTGNLVSFANMWRLRTDSHTQRETQEIARQIGSVIEPLFPVSWKALTDND